MRHSHKTLIVLIILTTCLGCAGSKSHIKALDANYPVSFSPAIRSSDGTILMEDGLSQVGTFDYSYRTIHMFWKIIPLSKYNYDLSGEINRQISASGGEGIVDLNISHSQNWWTAFGSILTLGIFPTYGDVTITGKIVKRTEIQQ